MLSMQGKNAVIFGVANKRSIAWAIAQRLNDAGAKLAITYQNERMKAEAHDLITSLPGAQAFQCDVSSDAEIDSFYARAQAALWTTRRGSTFRGVCARRRAEG